MSWWVNSPPSCDWCVAKLPSSPVEQFHRWWRNWCLHSARARASPCPTVAMTLGPWDRQRWRWRADSPGTRLHRVCAPSPDTDISTDLQHNSGVIMSPMASQITSLTIVYSSVYSGADQRKHQSPASLAFVRGIHRSSVNSPHKWSVTRKTFPLDDVIMT